MSPSLAPNAALSSTFSSEHTFAQGGPPHSSRVPGTHAQRVVCKHRNGFDGLCCSNAIVCTNCAIFDSPIPIERFSKDVVSHQLFAPQRDLLEVAQLLHPLHRQLLHRFSASKLDVPSQGLQVLKNSFSCRSSTGSLFMPARLNMASGVSINDAPVLSWQRRRPFSCASFHLAVSLLRCLLCG